MSHFGGMDLSDTHHTISSVSWAKCVSLWPHSHTFLTDKSHRIGIDKIFSRVKKDFIVETFPFQQYLKAYSAPRSLRKSLVAGLSSVWIDRIRGP